MLKAPTPLTLLRASRSLGSQPASLTLPMLKAPTSLTLLQTSRSLGSQLASHTPDTHGAYSTDAPPNFSVTRITTCLPDALNAHGAYSTHAP
ncbi:Hypothetical protein NTJ_15159 [Nesidiocoris tenuis]|uniref:Uncharacterized protein n=1 Tax=Nesidiocoris tenuis TaxID=355587 RepID=A0ABN7BD84_9HEMI|nr:Hypothetical protein NTJ_15159 [Nesidiocoris tenuis]